MLMSHLDEPSAAMFSGAMEVGDEFGDYTFLQDHRVQSQLMNLLDPPNMAIDPALTHENRIESYLNENNPLRLFEVNSGVPSAATVAGLTHCLENNLLEPPRYEPFGTSTLDPSSIDPSTPRDWAFHSPCILASDSAEYGNHFEGLTTNFGQPHVSLPYVSGHEIEPFSLDQAAETQGYSQVLDVDLEPTGDKASPSPSPSSLSSSSTNSSPTLSTSSHQDDRILPCPFRFAGCKAAFKTKNEWKRHTETIHLRLTYYICAHRVCGGGKKHAFNRRDLFACHYKRMHFPPNIANLPGGDGSLPPDWSKKLKDALRDAARTRCDPPMYLQCPVKDCAREFKGSTALDERMEHHAKHYDDVAAGRAEPFSVGGRDDPTFTRWAESKAVGVVKRTGDSLGWVLCRAGRGEARRSHSAKRKKQVANLAARASSAATVPALENGEDIDAEGEDMHIMSPAMANGVSPV